MTLNGNTLCQKMNKTTFGFHVSQFKTGSLCLTFSFKIKWARKQNRWDHTVDLNYKVFHTGSSVTVQDIRGSQCLRKWKRNPLTELLLCLCFFSSHSNSPFMVMWYTVWVKHLHIYDLLGAIMQQGIAVFISDTRTWLSQKLWMC